MKIGLVTIYTPEANDLREFELNRYKYCLDHGYHYLPWYVKLDNSRHPVWNKIKIVEKFLSQVDWIWWLDADAVILDCNFRVDTLIDNEYDFIVGRDHNDINAGVFLIKNSPASFRFLEMIWQREEYTKHHFQEQAAIRQLIHENPDLLKVKYIDRVKFNSYPHERQDGTFVVHFAGFGPMPAMRLEMMRQLLAEVKP